MTAVFAALTRNDIGDYVSALITVYTLLIFAYILTSLIFSFGARVPYSRWSDAILKFLRDVCEPYLRIFRRFLPSFGGLDLSPTVALIVLWVVSGIVIRLIATYA